MKFVNRMPVPRAIAFVTIAVVLWGSGQTSAVSPGDAQAIFSKISAPAYVPDEALVKFGPGATASSKQRFMSNLRIQKATHLDESGWMQLKLPAGMTVEQALVAYRADPSVELVQPNYVYRATVAPNDPNYPQQWPLRNIGQTVNAVPQAGSALYGPNNPGAMGNDLGMEAAWEHLTDCRSVTVAVVDTGVNYTHGDLAANMWDGAGAGFPNHGRDFIDNDLDPMDRNGHGTHIAGTLGAVGNNSIGHTGICWRASIMAVRVLDAVGAGTSTTVIQGINFAVANGAKVINLSLGGPSFDALLSAAVTNAQNNGVVVIVAAGNSGTNNDNGSTPLYPCNFTQPNVVCVAALDQGYQLATFSNYGATSVDVGAPGTNVLSAWAGSNALITDPLTSDWTLSGGWGFRNNGGTQFLINPAATFPTGAYSANTDERAYKGPFDIAGADVATWSGFVSRNVNNGDNFRITYRAGGGDPFAGGGTNVFDVTNVQTSTTFFLEEFDISGCISATCSIGLQLVSGPTLPKRIGVGIAGFSILTLTYNPTSHNAISGTSMATPHAAGIAAMVKAYNPLYTAADMASAVKNSGRPVASLAGRTTSGRAVDAGRALAYINPPTGLSASVQ